MRCSVNFSEDSSGKDFQSQRKMAAFPQREIKSKKGSQSDSSVNDDEKIALEQITDEEEGEE